ncbi:MAG: hypothetical protein KA419_18525 [Acidobacteria bacterium]|nr:hypothetical protein [Acidobacteriota bacterium]
MNRRFYIPLAVIILLFAASYLAFRLWDVEFLEYIVERTLQEKLHPDIDPDVVRQRFARVRRELADGSLSRAEYREGLLACAADMEKLVVIRGPNLDRLFGFFDYVRRRP